ncbi:MAG: lipopolysaccharide biosynthesis protein [Peptococcaceae bacterium]|nr:lipopolysaccharide biosynthesis protein [Peptococcaceae bacterium]
MENRHLEEETEIDLRQIWGILRKYFLLILVLPLVAATVAGVSVFFIVAPVYRAETTLLVRNQAATTAITHADLLASRQLVRTYREIARSRAVAVEVKEKLGLQQSVQQLQAMVDVTLRGDTEVIAISVESTNPEFAALLANAVGEAFQKTTIRVMQVENVMVVDRAVTPEYPVAPRKLLSVVVAGLLGGMTAVGLAFVLSYLDNTFKKPDDVERLLGLPVLGAIPLFKVQDFAKEQVGA